MTLSSQPVEAATFFSVNTSTFGGGSSQLGGFPGANLQGVSAAIPGSAVRMVGCTDRLRSANFVIASALNSIGDQVGVFVRNSDGSGFRSLATFLVEVGGVRLVGLSGEVTLYRGNRLANGSGQVTQGSFIPMSNAAGSAGVRTDLLTVRFSDAPDSVLASCMQLGLDIIRSNGVGRTAVVFTDLTVLRTEQEGDRLLTGTGLIGGLDGGYPTRAPCSSVCQPCPVGSLAVASAASYSAVSVAPDSISAIFGSSLATTTQAANQLPIPTSLGGTTVKVKDANGDERMAQIFFVSPNQINYLVPAETAYGLATVTVNDGDGHTSTGAVLITPIAPGLFSANSDGQGVAAAYVVRVKPDGTQIIESVIRYDNALGRFVPLSLNFGPQGDNLFLILYGTGLRRYQDVGPVSVKVGGLPMVVSSAGAQGTFLGLDQINVLLSRNLIGSGQINIELTVAGQISNVVTIAID